MATFRERITNYIAKEQLTEMRQEVALLRESIEFNDPQQSSWVQLGQSLDGETDIIDRIVALANSRYYWRRDPLFSRAVRLTRNYTFGRGVTWRASDPGVTRIIQAFWDDPDNKKVLTRAQGQWQTCDKLLVDGEIFPTFFVDQLRGGVKISLTEPEEVYSVIPDADNRAKIIYFYRKWFKREFNFGGKTWGASSSADDFYPDWNARETYPDAKKASAEQLSRGDDPTGARHSTVAVSRGENVVTRAYMTQLRTNAYGLRALPTFYPALVWASGYKGFMEDRATLTLAAATFAFKQKVKGGAAAVARMVTQWGGAITGRYGGTRGKERSEGGQILVENEAVDLQQFNVDTRAANAYQDGRMLRQQVGAAVDLTEPDLTGDPSVGNLASMTAMNGPQLKGFESWQQLFADFYADVFDFVIRQAIKHGRLDPVANGKPRDLTVEVDFPPVVVKDLPTIIGAIAQLITAQGISGMEYVAPRRLASYILAAFGETDVETALGELELDQLALPGLDSVEPDALPDDVADKVRETLGVLIEAIGNGRVKDSPVGDLIYYDGRATV